MPANRVHGTLLQRSVSFLFGITISDTLHIAGSGNLPVGRLQSGCSPTLQNNQQTAVVCLSVFWNWLKTA